MAPDFVRVYRAANALEAHMIRGMLENQGISVRLFGEGLSSGVGELPVDVVQVEIRVPLGYRQLAAELITGYERRRQTDESRSQGPACARCGETNPGNFDMCWNCGALLRTGGIQE